ANLAAFPAASAEFFVCPNLPSVSARICSSWLRSLVSALDDRNSKIPSPATPATTSSRPTYETGMTQLFSFSGSTSLPFRSRYQRLSAMVASGASKMTPTPTMMLAPTRQWNQRELSDSKDWRTISIGRESEARRDKEARYALIILGVLRL